MKIVVLTGAGISAPSGIKTFRDSDGLWENHRIEDVAAPEAWRKNRKLVLEFYNQRRLNVMDAQPNAAHLYLAELEKDYNLQIITQNVDDLHERAGSRNVLHLHGEIMLAKSSGPDKEKKYYKVKSNGLIETGDFCDSGYQLRPHIVWFGEDVPLYPKALEIAREADMLMVIGTSLQVYPAAALAYQTKPDCRLIIVDPYADEMQVPDNYIKISKSADQAVDDLKKIIGK
ncbi:MAG: NAD-dependent deacylase [Flavobacteriia bacterium]|nr:NAD-dependent deacylase [Flavobacteriia bacterium]OJX35920.1 MAG: NAD-dependent protein deacylase [Flavobacteriia bacterium 40-80]